MSRASNACTLVVLALTGCTRAAAEREPVAVTVSPVESATQMSEVEPERASATATAAVPVAPRHKTAMDHAREAHRAGVAAYARGDYDKAREHWETALEYQPSAIPLLYNVAEAALKQGDAASACRAVQRAELAGANPRHTAPLRAKLGSSCP